MYGVGMTSTSAPSLKENGDLLLEKYAHAISRELTTSTVFRPNNSDLGAQLHNNLLSFIYAN